MIVLEPQQHVLLVSIAQQDLKIPFLVILPMVTINQTVINLNASFAQLDTIVQHLSQHHVTRVSTAIEEFLLV